MVNYMSIGVMIGGVHILILVKRRIVILIGNGNTIISREEIA